MPKWKNKPAGTVPMGTETDKNHTFHTQSGVVGIYWV